MLFPNQGERLGKGGSQDLGSCQKGTMRIIRVAGALGQNYRLPHTKAMWWIEGARLLTLVNTSPSS